MINVHYTGSYKFEFFDIHNFHCSYIFGFIYQLIIFSMSQNITYINHVHHNHIAELVNHVYWDWVNTRKTSELPAQSSLRSTMPDHFKKAAIKDQLVLRMNHHSEQRKSRLLRRMGLTGQKKKEYDQAGGVALEVCNKITFFSITFMYILLFELVGVLFY